MAILSRIGRILLAAGRPNNNWLPPPLDRSLAHSPVNSAGKIAQWSRDHCASLRYSCFNCDGLGVRGSNLSAKVGSADGARAPSSARSVQSRNPINKSPAC